MVHGGEVDARGAFGGAAVAQCLPDDAHWGALVIGVAGPGVSRHIHGEGHGEVQLAAEAVEGFAEMRILGDS